MAEISQELRKILFGRGARWTARGAEIIELFGFACLIVGIISDATNKVFGLETAN